MANLFNRNGNNNPEDEQPWAPLGVQPITPPVEEPAIQEPAEAPGTPASLPETPSDSVITEPKAAERKPARKEKAKKADATPAKRKVGRPKKDNEQKQLTTVPLPLDLHYALHMMRLSTKVPVTDIIVGLCSDMIQNTYECDAPACNMRFVVRTGIGGEAPLPTACPCCGGKVRRVKSKGGSF